MTDSDMLEPKRRGRSKKETPAVMTEEPPLTIDEPGVLEEFDRIFGDDLTAESERDLEEFLATQALEQAEATPSTKPAANKFLDLGSGLYLPVRQRIVWMRGEPVPHPDWLIQTDVLEFQSGSYSGQKTVYLGGQLQDVSDVKDGYAVVKARVITTAGNTIGEGTAMERSETFHDFIEKAETAAIGRALAVAGYGTEAAIDLDEGPNNLADAPVRVTVGGFVPPVASAPPPEIKIEPSAIPGVQQGGRQTKATNIQINAIRERAKDLSLTPSALQLIVREAVPPPNQKEDVPDFYLTDVDDDTNGANDVMGFLADLSFEECGKVVLALMDPSRDQ